MRKGAFGDLEENGNCFLKQQGYGSRYSIIQKGHVERLLDNIKNVG